MIIAVVNNKGGVGKTTTAVNLAAALASPTRHALLVDLDSQASASLWCGVARAHLRPSAANCLLESYPILEAIRQTPTPNLDLLTGSLELANADIALCHVRGREIVLRRTLATIHSQYDYIILDCPPSLSLLGVNALTASDALLVPVPPEPLSIEGLINLLANVEKVRTRLSAKARVVGIVLTMIDARRKGSREAAERLRAQYRDRIFRTEIHWSPSLLNAPAAGKTIFTFAPRSTAASAFKRLAGEVVQRLPAPRH